MDSCVAIIRLHQHTADLVVCAYWLYLVFFGRDVAFHMRKLTIQIVNLSLLLLVMTLTECASLSPYLILELLKFS